MIFLKKFFAILTVLVLIFCLCACDKDNTSSGITDNSSIIESSSETQSTDETSSKDTTSSSKPTDTSKPTQSSNPVTPTKPEYIVKNDTYFSYKTPILKTDESTGESYYVMRYVGLGIYPNGSTIYDPTDEEDWETTYTNPVIDFGVTELTLIPKYNCPECLKWIQNYILNPEESGRTDWVAFFENESIWPSEYIKEKIGNDEYLAFSEPISGELNPIYSYTVNSDNGKVALKKENDADTGCELVSLTLKPNTEKKLTAKITINGKAEEIEMTAK